MNAARILLMCINLFYGNVLFVFCDLYTSEVKLPQGAVVGLHMGGYKGYLGIPYASVPKRFREPGPPPVWNGTFYATDGSVKCYQMLPVLNIPVGREDCLVANIYTPSEISKESLLPVMLFIHGGGFYYGSNTNLLYDAKYLVQKGVIVVTINYRLGAFGFLCLNDTEVTGNMGLKDQIAALRWIKENIKSFGGDPNLVTLFGESAGAISVHYIAFSKLSRGLFKRIIMESGSILIPIAFNKNPLANAQLVTSKLGYDTTNSSEILEILQNTDAKDIILASNSNENPNKLQNSSFPYIFLPCMEDPTKTKNPFLTMSPRKLLKKNRLDPNIDVIIGYNNKEGLMFASAYDRKDLNIIDKDLSQILPRNLKFRTSDEKLNLAKDIRKLYFGNKPLDDTSYNGLINFFSDSLIIYPSFESAKAILQSNLTVYNYLFKYGSLRNLNKFISGRPFTQGANHADELFYIFDPILYKFLPSLPKDKMIIDVMTSSWANFAKTGNPSTDNIKWVKSEIDNLNFLSLGNEIKTIPLPFKERMQFWKKVYAAHAAY